MDDLDIFFAQGLGGKHILRLPGFSHRDNGGVLQEEQCVHDICLQTGLGKVVLQTKRLLVLHDPQPITPAGVKIILAPDHDSKISPCMTSGNH
jgi:hypothetical protein